ncbi:DUF63 family protein [Candidatus Hodarchaeum mangrovi]
MALNQNLIQEFIDTLIQDLIFLLSDPISFLDTYFFSAPGYNLYNTIIYTSLGIVAIFLIGKIIIRINKFGTDRWGEEHFKKVQMDTEFFLSILPYIFIGSTLRALQDIAKQEKILPILNFPYQIFEDRLFVTPGVYIFTIVLTLFVGISSIFISQEYLQDSRRFSNWRVTFFTIGVGISIFLFIPIFPLLIIQPGFFEGGFVILILTGLFAFLFTKIAKIISNKNKPNSSIRFEESSAMITQMFDAFNTVIAIEFFGYQEKHYLPSLIFEGPFGSWPFLIIKFIVVLLFIWAVRGFENENIEKWLLWVVFLLGLATGTRDFLRLVTGT